MSDLDKILYRIKSNGWSISEFERRLGVSTGTVNGWRIRNAVPEKHFNSIVRILDTTEAYLRGETDDPRPDERRPVSQDGHPINPEVAKLIEISQDLNEEEAETIRKIVEAMLRGRK